ncbi:MAG: flagellar biosynthesis protein FlgK, partial [Lachnospiraceae bacterium]|nr:flagellar biosynthesis protein FlgK [Lachnospiraceae bacterium]
MVRATFAGFSTALSALQSSQKRLDITGHNLANMNTIGYTRQELQTSSLNYTSPVSTFMNGSEVIVGFGVHMDKVAQIRDPYLDAQYRSQMDKSGYTDSMQTSLDSLSKIFDESTISGIHSAFLDIRGALTEMHDVSKINDPIYESELRSKIQTLTNMLNQASKDIDEAESQEFNRLVGKNTTENGAQEQVNDMLRQIGELNRQIKRNQILGQQSLELMDERNNLLDKLSSFLPIEVTYYKDPAHDGVDANGDPALEENYYLDKNGNIIGKKEWPDDVRVEMVYTDKDGNEQRLTLVEGSEGSKGENYGSISFEPADDTKPLSKNNFKLVINGSEKDLVNNNPGGEIEFAKDTTNPPNTTITNQLGSGSIQSSLDMLWKDGSTATIDDVRGYQFYRDELDKLARSFAYVMNEINIAGTSTDPNATNKNQYLLANKKDGTYDPANLDQITAANIGINTQWSNGSVHVSMAGKNPTDTVLYMLEAMGATYPNTNQNIAGIDRPVTNGPTNIGEVNLNKNSFADFMNNVSTILANDSYSNSLSLKMNVTVLNGIQNSR